MDIQSAVGGDVSRETLERLKTYVRILNEWNPKINLVASGTLPDVWNRHILDSAQIFRYAGLGSDLNPGLWADLGSGGGFPGLVIAILARELQPDLEVKLVESDARKSTFLRTVIRETGLTAKVETQRIEHLAPLKAKRVSARALAPLPLLLSYVDRHLAPGGSAFLMKGETWKKELDEAMKTWKFTCVAHKSVTNPSAVVLEIGELGHV